VLHLGKLLALPTNIILGCRGLPETNTLAYSDYLSIMDVKSFIRLGPGVEYRKGFILVRAGLG
jgi:hypothetical protein